MAATATTTKAPTIDDAIAQIKDLGLQVAQGFLNNGQLISAAQTQQTAQPSKLDSKTIMMIVAALVGVFLLLKK